MIATNETHCTVRDQHGEACGITAIGQGVADYTPIVCAFHAKCMVFCGFHVRLFAGTVLTLSTWRSSNSAAAAKDLERRYRPVSEVAEQLHAVHREIRHLEKATTLRVDAAQELVRLYDRRNSLDRKLIATFEAVY